jgi:NAD-dependent dihydropyrimidine dehydrogenase PreA subunit
MLVLSLGSMLGLKRALGVDVPVLLLLVGLAAAVTLLYEPEVFHNRICPFGAIQRLAGKQARFGKTVSTEACVGCGLCVNACDSGAVRMLNRKAVIDPALCHQCQSCTVVCPKQAIAYGRLLRNVQ